MIGTLCPKFERQDDFLNIGAGTAGGRADDVGLGGKNIGDVNMAPKGACGLLMNDFCRGKGDDELEASQS